MIFSQTIAKKKIVINDNKKSAVPTNLGWGIICKEPYRYNIVPVSFGCI